MLKLLTKSIRKPFCIAPQLQKTYQLIYQIKDVTIMRGLKSQLPYINLDGAMLAFPTKKLIFQMIEDLGVDKGSVQFFDKHMNVYHPLTPVKLLCIDSFYIKKSNNLYYVMNNEPIIKQASSQEFLSTYCSPLLQDVCRQSLSELPKDENQTISGAAIHNLLISNLLKYGMHYKIEKIRLKQLMKIIDRQVGAIQKQISEIFVKVELKANKRLKYFTNFLLTQYAIMHYFIYFHLSWDIMEPITVLFANCDIFFAYYFFILKGRDWTLQSIHKNYIQQKKWTFLQKNGINIQKYKQLLSIKQNVEFRLSLLSKNPYQLTNILQKPIKLLDTQ